MRMRVRIPQELRFLSGIPAVELQVFSFWQMEDGKIGVWLGLPSGESGQRWPLTNITMRELQSWRVDDATQ